ncbi:hypothetical protein B7R21_19560 [Subtercola boreus]|uniref:Uncharacterized protein n=1 Tax=Subtercola boreus TaxID=120213 RepID=A0A3E0VAQ9_9MICO|nr:hypothetical protein [Subtercola boreus]RFA06568.1 hypothetical protein B7R21_19560 [Subtercola boreus]
MTMLKLSQGDAADKIAWLADAAASTSHGAVVGYDISGWDDSVWVLHSMYKDVESSADAPNKRPRTLLGEATGSPVDLSTGIPLEYSPTPVEKWTRLPWSELACRLNFELGAGMSNPPSDSWLPPALPANILAPNEGQLNEKDLQSVVDAVKTILPETTEECIAFFAALPAQEFDSATVYSGSLNDLQQLVRTETGHATPSNIWPIDRTWFIYTDWDLLATKISGPVELINAIEASPELETIRWPVKPNHME